MPRRCRGRSAVERPPLWVFVTVMFVLMWMIDG
jgi:hypothetical protein